MKVNTYRNSLIVFEGKDASGKGTQIQKLLTHLNERVKSNILLPDREIILLERRLGGLVSSDIIERVTGKTRYGGAVLLSDLSIDNPTIPLRAIWEALGDSTLSQQFLTYMMHVLSKNTVIENLLPYFHVIVDRYYYSVIARHKALGVNTEMINLDSFSIIQPDITFFLNASDKIRKCRMEARGNINEADIISISPDQPLYNKTNIIRDDPHTTPIDTTSDSEDQTFMKIVEVVGRNLEERESPKGNAFSNELYLKSQRTAFREGVERGIPGEPLVIEFGGKVLDDQHAGRVLPGFNPNIKIELLKELSQIASVIVVVNYRDIMRPRIRGDNQVYYDSEVHIMVHKLKEYGINVETIVIAIVPKNLSEDETAVLLNTFGFPDEKDISVELHYEIDNYPSEVILGESTLSENTNLKTKKGNIILISPGGGSGKFGVALAQVNQWLLQGKNPHFVKFETFPVFNLPITHPLNLAFISATADLGNTLSAGLTLTQYDKDVENFQLLKKLLSQFDHAVDNPLLQLDEPSQMGVNMITSGITDMEEVSRASVKELRRRIERYKRELIDGVDLEATLKRALDILNSIES